MDVSTHRAASSKNQNVKNTKNTTAWTDLNMSDLLLSLSPTKEGSEYFTVTAIDDASETF